MGSFRLCCGSEVVSFFGLLLVELKLEDQSALNMISHGTDLGEISVSWYFSFEFGQQVNPLHYLSLISSC